MPLRDFLIAPRAEQKTGEAAWAGERVRPREADAARSEAARREGREADAARSEAAARRIAARGRLRFSLRARERPGAATLAPSLGVLANARDLPAVAVAVGVVLARRNPAALVCVHAPGHELPAPALRAPARAAAARLAASLGARGLAADARGRVTVVEVASEEGNAAGAAARALAAAGALATVLAVAVRDPDLDVLLAAQDAILVALPPSTDPTLAELAASGAARLAPRATSIAVNLDPASRALALAGLRAPAALRTAVEELVA
jgi:hypothetical protein